MKTEEAMLPNEPDENMKRLLRMALRGDTEAKAWFAQYGVEIGDPIDPAEVAEMTSR